MSLPRTNHWIQGRDAAPASGEYLPTLDPMNKQPWAQIAAGDEADVRAAVTAADDSFRTWRRVGPTERANILWKLGDLIGEHAEELADLESRDAGKVIREVLTQQNMLSTWYRYYASLAYQLDGRQIPHDKASLLTVTVREPYGVIGVIPAFNSPMLLGSMSLAPAIAAGNTVVVKPPEVNSQSLHLLAKLATEAGLPDGVLNVVHGYGAVAGDALVGDPRVRKVFFTGGVDSARFVTARAAQGLKQSVLELGGKSANIFFQDVDLDRAVDAVVTGIFAAAGQTCIAGSRLLVHESIADELVHRIAARARSIRLGDPRDPQTEMGPMSQAKIYDGVVSRVAKAVEQGAAVEAGGLDQLSDQGGWFFPPTVLNGVTNDMDVAQSELFGPVLSVIRFGDEDEAVAIANDTPFGLAAGVWTNDFRRAHRVARELDAGTIWVNTYRSLHPATPFGGIKDSGHGRENGLDGFAEFTQPKAIWFESDENAITDPFSLR